jgi:hypothetical protein
MNDMNIERPEADSAEQEQDVVPETDRDEDEDRDRELPLEADPADAAEQGREVDSGEDEYR